MREERISSHRNTKLHVEGDLSCQILERIYDNAYKLDVLSIVMRVLLSMLLTYIHMMQVI